MTIDIAGAPVSFGVFELADPATTPHLPSPDRMCEVLSSQGYDGIDLGPIGYLGRGADLRDRLARHGLQLAGGWIDLPFSDDEAFRAALSRLDGALDVFVEAGDVGTRDAKPTLADSGDASRQAQPGGGPGLSLTGHKLDVFARNVQIAASRVRDRGFEPTFHHHVATFVETPEEVQTFLDRTDVGLTFDTGHLLLGGGDPLAGWSAWRERINHIHLKDVDLSVLRAVQQRGGQMLDVWSSRAFVPIGEGDVDVAAVVAAILTGGYDGWIVLEQDVIPTAEDDPAQLERDQLVNIEQLRALLPA